MSDPTVQGTVHVIEETKTYGQNGFRKRLVVLEQPLGRFTNYIPVDFIQDGCDTVDDMNVGDEVEVTYRLSGRKWQRDPSSETRFFLNAEAITFRVLNSEGADPPSEFVPDAPHPSDEPGSVEPSDDDIPF